MKGFGVHTSMWTMNWDRDGAEAAVEGAVKYGMDFIEIALLQPDRVDAAHTRDLLERSGLRAVCSLGLPEAIWPSRGHVDEASAYLARALDVAAEMGAEALSGVTYGGIGERTGEPPTDAELDNVARALEAAAYLKRALDVTAEMGAEALSGVTYGGIGERTGLPPTQGELDNVARALEAAAKHAAARGLAFGIEPVNRYENHLINTGWQAVAMVEKVGQPIFVHLDTYHMNIEEKGAANGVLDAREHLRYIHLSESDRGTPGEGCCDWDEVYAALAAIRFDGGLAMESFINMPPEVAYGLSVWRPVAESHEEVMSKGLPFLRNKAAQYGLVR